MKTEELPKWIQDGLNYKEPLHPALEPWIFETAVMGPMIKHPFLFQAIGDDRPGMLVKQANDTYAAKMKMRRSCLDEGDWWGILFFLVERPFRMQFLHKAYHAGRISYQRMCELLPEVWLDTEAPQVNQADPMFLFKEAVFTTDDQAEWEEISRAPIKLYRGVDGVLELTKDGPSWTTSLDVAKWFGNRGAKGKVYTYTANPSEALAYLTNRGESEIILDFDGDSKRRNIRLYRGE